MTNAEMLLQKNPDWVIEVIADMIKVSGRRCPSYMYEKCVSQCDIRVCRRDSKEIEDWLKEEIE